MDNGHRDRRVMAWREPPVSVRATGIAIFGLAALASGVTAQGRYTPRFSVDAFGALGVAYSTERRADFVEIITRREGAGFSHRFDPSLDSRIAGQATVSFGPRITAVLQIMAEQTLDNDYRPHTEWAYVGYAFTPDFQIRGGRIVLPVFMVSDARKISYANPWMRPPVEIYGMVPVYSLDGIDVTYSRHVGDWTVRLNSVFGRTDIEFPGTNLDAERAVNINATFSRGAFTSRFAGARAKLELKTLAPLFDAFRAFGPEGEAIADRFDVDGSATQFATAGFELDPGGWFAMAEIGWSGAQSAFGERLGGHLTSGVRWQAFTTYAMYARTGILSETSVNGLSVEGLPPEHAQIAAGLNAGLNALLKSSPEQQNLAIGGRWDFRSGMALKAQLDFVDVLGGSDGTFINVQPGFEQGGAARVFSIATVFVF
jgi:hypothetical protein